MTARSVQTADAPGTEASPCAASHGRLKCWLPRHQRLWIRLRQARICRNVAIYSTWRRNFGPRTQRKASIYHRSTRSIAKRLACESAKITIWPAFFRTGLPSLAKRSMALRRECGLLARQNDERQAETGQVSKMCQRDLGRFLIAGAMAVVRWTIRRGGKTDPWMAICVAALIASCTQQHPPAQVATHGSPALQSKALAKSLQKVMNESGIRARCEAYLQVATIECIANMPGKSVKTWTRVGRDVCRSRHDCIQQLYGWKST